MQIWVNLRALGAKIAETSFYLFPGGSKSLFLFVDFIEIYSILLFDIRTYEN